MQTLPGTRHRPGIAGETDEVLAEIDDFAQQIDRYRAGKVPEAVFLEHRLRFGVYGQRQDGVHMLRSKNPLGLLAPDQLDAFADLTERYTAGIAHLTTRQDIQTHFVDLEASPEVMRTLARVEATTREACGNVVRNVTASEVSGVWPGEAFDVTAHGMALARFLLRHPDGQSLGRKFKITLASTDDPRWNLAAIHDIGATARLRDGVRGFQYRVGGGLGAVPHLAATLYEFLPETELLPVSLAVVRVFARLGEKRKRARARLKFLVASLGLDAFRAEVERERAALGDDPAWTAWLASLDEWNDRPLHPPGRAFPAPRDADVAQWLRSNVHPQRQPGYAIVKVRVPRGDLTPFQLRGIAALLREHAGDTLRIGIDQSLVIRWVPVDRLAAVRDALRALDLGEPRAGGLDDVVTCPGADTCKLGVTSPRALARHIAPSLAALAEDPRLAGVSIKVSGCPNSCAQHQIADIGLFGGARTVQGVTAPHYLMMFGGSAAPDEEAGDPFALPVIKVPAYRAGDAIETVLRHYLDEARPDETFRAFVRRIGRAGLKPLLAPFTALPSPVDAPEFYREHGQAAAAFTVRRGVGECEGEIVDLADMLIAEADRAAEAAADALEDGADPPAVIAGARRAMEIAARALLSLDGLVNPREFDTAAEFRARFQEAGRIFEGVGDYLLAAPAPHDPLDPERLRRLVVEAGLFVEEAHTVLGRARSPWRGSGAAA